jgi:hypothetical protein
MKLFIAISACILFASCITEKKVNRWNNEHEMQAAKYCADKFPIDTLTKTVIQNIDSAGYYDAYMNMSYLADSLFWKLDSIQYLPPEQRSKLNIDSIRKVVDKEIRKRLNPCVDTVKVVTNTVVDRAREKYLQGLVDKKDGVITGLQDDNHKLMDKVKAKRKWVWMFWGLIALIAVYVFAKIRFKIPL